VTATLSSGYATDVLTYHNDNFRSGLNSSEFILTTQTVASKFGHLFDLAVDGKVDAQPLYVGGVTIGGGTHNVLYVATENDSIYAFDADTGTKYLQVSLLTNGDVPSDNHGCTQVTPQIGITATPVIDRSQGAHGTIFLVTMTKDTGGAYHQRLHALDLTTFAEELAGPKEIAAVLHGEGTTGPEHNASGDLTFNPGQYKERAALVLTNGIIYLSFASHCDDPPYTGWMKRMSLPPLKQMMDSCWVSIGLEVGCHG
jgi:outer membrane protein assembly factor BamB